MSPSLISSALLGVIKGDDIVGIIVSVLVGAYLIYVLVNAEKI